jgi:hypothetical protein
MVITEEYKMTLTDLLQLLGILSGMMFVASLLFVPWLVSRLTADYFIRHRRQVEERRQFHPVLAFILWFLRNVAGVVLLVAGIAMLVLPGQGILTLLIGISLMDFPGKHRLLESFVQLRQVRKSLNWIRRKAGKEEFMFR